jgi:trans-aconitate methyltransferase
MNERFANVYDDKARADAYARLEFPGTYYLAYRDLPAIIAEHVRGRAALDFGCGAGRSTRFLRQFGFDPVLGVDSAEQMITQARRLDPEGAYQLVPDGDLGELASGTYDLVLSAFTFDNIPADKKIALFQSLRRLLTDSGRIVNLVSSPEIYVHEWASFSTQDFPDNRTAASGDKVQIVMLDVEDRRPVEDILCTNKTYHGIYDRAGLALVDTYRPLALEAEPFTWVSETKIAPWVIYVLGRADEPAPAPAAESERAGIHGNIRERSS